MNTTKILSGFQKLNPETDDWQTRVDTFLKQKSEQKNTLAYFNMVCKQGPYDFFVTLTFREGTGKFLMIKSTSYLLHLLNQKIYGRKYNKKKIAITGFATIEKHKSQMFDEREHIHLILKSNKKFPLKDHEEILSEIIGKIVNSKGNEIFNLKSTDIRKYEDEGAIAYIMKGIKDSNIDGNFKIITTDGISDYI